MKIDNGAFYRVRCNTRPLGVGSCRLFVYDDGGGTCFAGFGKVCEESLTPDLAKADRLRHQTYW